MVVYDYSSVLVKPEESTDEDELTPEEVLAELDYVEGSIKTRMRMVMAIMCITVMLLVFAISVFVRLGGEIGEINSRLQEQTAEVSYLKDKIRSLETELDQTPLLSPEDSVPAPVRPSDPRSHLEG